MELIYLLDRNNYIKRIDSPQWDSFAQENGAEELTRRQVEGQSLWRFIHDKETRGIYQTLFERCRELQKTITVPFRCDSPGKRRFMQMIIAPLPDEELQLCSRLLEEEPRHEVRWLQEGQVATARMLLCCSMCKRVRSADDSWQEIEEALKQDPRLADNRMPQLSHSICPDCMHDLRRQCQSMTEEAQQMRLDSNVQSSQEEA